MRTVRLTEKVGARAKGTLVSYDERSAAALVTAGSAEAVEPASGFDPAEHTVDEVLEHLAKSDEVEQHRVLSLEQAGKARVGVLGA